MTRVEPAAPASVSEPGVLEAAALGLAYADRLLLRTVRDTHRALARRMFGLVPGRDRTWSVFPSAGTSQRAPGSTPGSGSA